jgi:hypothetical protein
MLVSGESQWDIKPKNTISFSVLTQEAHCTIFPLTAKPQEWINITNHKRLLCLNVGGKHEKNINL